MPRFNFRKASCDADVRKQKLADMNEDLLNILDQPGGVGRFAADGEFQVKLGTLLRETIQDGFAMTDPTPIFVERRSARLGDTIEFTKLVNTFRVVKYAPMSHPLIFTPKKTKYTISTTMYEHAVGIDLQKILTRQHTVEEFADMSAEALTRHNAVLSMTAIDTACATGTTDVNGRNLRTTNAGDVAQASIDAQLRRLGVYQSGLTIFASRYALDPIFDLGAAAAESVAEELQARGVIGTYRGANLVAVQDDYNEFVGSWTTVNGTDWENLLFVAGAQKGAVLLERDLSPLDWQETDPEKAYFRSGIRFDHGILVYAPWKYGVIELT